MYKITGNASFKAAMRLSALVFIAAPMLSACSGGGVPDFINNTTKFASSTFGVKASPRVTNSKNIKKGGGRAVVGKPYKVAGTWYTPKHQPNYDKTGAASWYGPNFHGRKTANGEVFDQFAITAAHPTLPLPSYVRVTNLENNRSMVVRVNDRGPFVHGREIDLSRRAAELLGYQQKGIARVRVKYISRAPTEGDDTRMLMASLNGPVTIERGNKSNSRVASRNTQKPKSTLVRQPRSAPTKQRVASAPTPSARKNVVVTAEGFNLVQPAPAKSNGLGALFYAPEISATPGLKLNTAFAATEALANNNLPTQRGTKTKIDLGTFTDHQNAQNILTAFSLIGAIDVWDVEKPGTTATRLVLSHLKPGVTKSDVVERAASLGLQVQFMYE